MQYDIDSAELH